MWLKWNTDPDRPKNDKATILTDTIQMLKDLTARVNRLKAECASLTEESREVTSSQFWKVRTFGEKIMVLYWSAARFEDVYLSFKIVIHYLTLQ